MLLQHFARFVLRSMVTPDWLVPMDRGDEDLLDRAYRRRVELMGQPGVRWVRMTLEARGVTFVTEDGRGGKRTEWMPRCSEPADGGSPNGDYDRE
jgi:hypothetical protein